MRPRPTLLLLLLLPLAACAKGTPPPAATPCPESPNCVSSRADPADAVHYIAPLVLQGSPDEALAALRAVIEATPRAEVVSAGDGALGAVYISRLLRFRDDVSFEVDPAAGVIHVRSASRLGYGDMGVNRERVESIRAALGQ
jgi:uncharacterized protein (DUF1499 family)